MTEEQEKLLDDAYVSLELLKNHFLKKAKEMDDVLASGSAQNLEWAAEIARIQERSPYAHVRIRLHKAKLLGISPDADI